jgi:subtilisin family serine protease
LPTSAIGAAQFIASHPTFDGRGVVVAVVDTNIDLLLPELRTAKALDGRPVPKFADIYSAAPNALVKIAGDSNPSGYMRVEMETKIAAAGKKLTYLNESYVVPRDDQYRVGMLNERVAGSSGDLNRDGNPPGSRELFAVLWDQTTDTVWIDTNQNFDFTDEKPMTDYHSNYDVGTFGRDDPKTAPRETVGFIIQTDAPHQAVFIIPGYGGHGTGVAGAAFGANFFGGNINGVAPAAQIISVPPGRGSNVTPCYIEAVIAAQARECGVLINGAHAFMADKRAPRTAVRVLMVPASVTTPLTRPSSRTRSATRVR